MILCGGDALIDFVPEEQANGSVAFVPKPGGAVLNAATALARLKQEVSFIGALSTDLFGDMLHGHMVRESIGTANVERSDDDSTLAFVSLANGEARYAFYDRTSAGRLWTGLRDPLPAAEALHFGSLPLFADPPASAYVDLAEQASSRMVVSLDPNCRPSLVPDKEAYCRRIARVSTASHIIRLSDEDLAFLYPSAGEEEVVGRLLEGLTRLVIVSRGAKGASAWWGGGRVDVAAHQIDVQDSIGAGDTFHAGVLAALSRDGQLEVEALDRLDRASVEYVLAFGTAAAALSCMESGCDPPSLNAVLKFLGE